jgi:hypothetical protein
MHSMANELRAMAAVIASIVALAGAGCDTKVSECNKLVSVTRKHNPELSGAMDRLSTIQSNPKVLDEFVAVVNAASEDIAALSFGDAQVAGFAKEYVTMLENADAFGKTLGEAARTNDVAALDRATAAGEELTTTEAAIVERVNGYCRGE